MHGILTCMGRHTITGWLTASGDQFKDWSSAYRLFKGDRMDIDGIFGVVRRRLVRLIDPGEHYVFAHMDDTLFRKKGKKVFGARWMRDPLGPPFQTNLMGTAIYPAFTFLFHQNRCSTSPGHPY